VQGDNDEWDDNHTSGNDFGVDVFASGNSFHDNDFRGNLGVDCYDGSSGSGTASTANTWTNDLGNIQSPEGICIPDA
jgi:nitrous oxidase accessory protein NosD